MNRYERIVTAWIFVPPLGYGLLPCAWPLWLGLWGGRTLLFMLTHQPT